MLTNAKTGKGWTDEEEAAFAELQAAGGLDRLPAIRLWKRFHKNMQKALQYAGCESMAARTASLVKARARKRLNRATFQTQSPAAGLSRSGRTLRHPAQETATAGVLEEA